jgi:hypothetical protein
MKKWQGYNLNLGRVRDFHTQENRLYYLIRAMDNTNHFNGVRFHMVFIFSRPMR